MKSEKLKCEKCGELFTVENLTKLQNHIYCKSCSKS